MIIRSSVGVIFDPFESARPSLCDWYFSDKFLTRMSIAHHPSLFASCSGWVRSIMRHGHPIQDVQAVIHGVIKT